MANTRRIVTLLTDFGTEDGYVGAMKGVLLAGSEQLVIHDISHQIQPYNIRQAAFALNNYYGYFPEGTVHVVVVDPGVGTQRYGLLIRTEKYYFIGPDNGVFSFIYENEVFQGFRLLEDKINRDASKTFHGRDIFSPSAVKIAEGVNHDTFTEPEMNFVSFYEPYEMTAAGNLNLKILHVDHFGNLILNLSYADWKHLGEPQKVKIRLKQGFIYGIHKTFGDARVGQVLALWDSSGFLQIVQNQGSAAKTLEMQADDKITVQI